MRLLKKAISFLFSRLFLVALMLLLQISLLTALIVYFNSVFFIYLGLLVLSILAVMVVVNGNENPLYKLTWSIAILIFPAVGGVFYLVFGNRRMPRKLKKYIDRMLEGTKLHMPLNHLGQDMRADNPQLALLSDYIYNVSGYPAWHSESAEYFPVGEAMYARMVQELEKARQFIFLEYFIIRPGEMWDNILDILARKVREGIEVRLMYDDLGCIGTMTKAESRKIRRAGIRLQVFNPFRPRISVLLNHRDHRKICVVDSKVAFCGGLNLADEYINRIDRFGHWKDTGVMITGEAVWGFTFMFLEQWQFSSNERVDFDAYHAAGQISAPGNGLVQVFGDSPLDDYNATETAYLGIISRACQYVYITSPYLVIDNEMEAALCSAAQSGIDVRIITPYRYDKWYVHMLTRSHYKRLIKAGVRIFEYTPGFIHGKMFVSDDMVCMVGTCNLDFRSLYLHFECSAAFYLSDMVDDVKADILEAQKVSHEITPEEAANVPVSRRMLTALLKLFAPLM